jgi:hypothetical protein
VTERKPDFWTYGLMLAGALIATTCGLCTMGAGASTLPLVLSGNGGSEAPYAWMFLLPALVIGGVATWFGAYLFRAGHHDLKLARAVRRDSLDTVASLATVAAGVLFGLAWLAITVRVAVSGVHDLMQPRTFDAGAGVLWLALAVAIGAGGAILGARIALGGLKGLRPKEGDEA